MSCESLILRGLVHDPLRFHCGSARVFKPLLAGLRVHDDSQVIDPECLDIVGTKATLDLLSPLGGLMSV